MALRAGAVAVHATVVDCQTLLECRTSLTLKEHLTLVAMSPPAAGVVGEGAPGEDGGISPVIDGQSLIITPDIMAARSGSAQMSRPCMTRHWWRSVLVMTVPHATILWRCRGDGWGGGSTRTGHTAIGPRRTAMKLPPTPGCARQSSRARRPALPRGCVSRVYSSRVSG